MNADVKTVNHWGFWVSSDTPVTGVLNCHSTEWVYEETDYRAVANLSYDGAWEHELGERTAQWARDNGHDDQFGYAVDPPEELVEDWQQEFNDSYVSDGETYLIGDWQQGSDGLWDYVTNGNEGYAAIVNYDSNTIQVVYSRWVTRSALCSPCYPGQVDLDSEGEFLGYDLPIEFYGEYRQNSNPQFEYVALQPSLFDGELSDTPFVDAFIKAALDKLDGEHNNA